MAVPWLTAVPWFMAVPWLTAVPWLMAVPWLTAIPWLTAVPWLTTIPWLMAVSWLTTVPWLMAVSRLVAVITFWKGEDSACAIPEVKVILLPFQSLQFSLKFGQIDIPEKRMHHNTHVCTYILCIYNRV